MERELSECSQIERTHVSFLFFILYFFCVQKYKQLTEKNSASRERSGSKRNETGQWLIVVRGWIDGLADWLTRWMDGWMAQMFEWIEWYGKWYRKNEQHEVSE